MKSLLFKVEHGDWSAELQLPANYALYDLAEAIISAVGFDLDHCFGFYDNMKCYFESEEEYTLFADIGEEANESDPGVQGTSIESVFKPGKKLLFLFDYGDDWMFPVTCTGELQAKPFKRPKVLSTTGKPPAQYQAWEDEEENRAAASDQATMDTDLDPTDHMPSRAALARETLLFRMRMLSKLFYEHEWVEDLEFEIWDMAHVKPARFADKDVTKETAKFFRDLIKLGGGFWAWPEVVGQEGDHEVFVPLAKWKKVLAKRKQ